MCGICGVLTVDGQPPDSAVVGQMLASLIHRGPDHGAVVVDHDGPLKVALGNRRLAILDLSPAGNLPMQTADGALSVAYNGEIYNHLELRPALEAAGETFRSTSDAETLLALYRRDGAAALAHLRGMFAFALWDRAEQTLLLARDRLGEKPLYYYHDSERLIFASEIKALLQHPDVPRRSALTPERLALYLGYGYTPAPETAFVGIKALPPGHLLTIRAGEPLIDATPQSYWKPPEIAGPRPFDALAEREAVEAVRAALGDAVRQCLISDVPLGAFLSGGLDSSLIAALMRAHSSGPVKTFSIGFTGDSSFDETAAAQRVADHLGTEHTAFTVEPTALDLVPKLVWHHDQPFADSSAIPTYLVSELTRAQVTVALTGDGGDELFAGYERFYAASLLQRTRRLPRAAWGGFADVLEVFPEGTGYYDRAKRLRRFARGASLPPTQAYFYWLRVFDPAQTRALSAASFGLDPAGVHFAKRFTRGALRGATTADLLDINLRTYLPDDLLIKTDRSSMAVSLETRAPFLDHHLVEIAAALPVNLKLNKRITKYVLKQAARGLLPDDIIDRPKHGFGVPLGAWLRADIAAVRDVLLSGDLRKRGLLNLTAVEQMTDAHTRGHRDHGARLWALLTLEWWYRLFIDPPEMQPEMTRS
ncbi:MAG: asparagine synthase (glutamine-hydrolyzing) [Chloroflexi bacterium]|nr:asparagine synthase (glutamine-hydrolyzing) [Chloroflexota bacterium]